MKVKSAKVVKLGPHSKAVEVQNKRLAINRLVEIGFKVKLVSDAFEGEYTSVKGLSVQLLEAVGEASPTLLRYSVGVMVAACYNAKKSMPAELVKLIFSVLETEKFNRRKAESLEARKELALLVVAFPNASLTAAGKYLGRLFQRKKVHVETIKNWCREIGIDELLHRVSNDHYEDVAILIKAKCKRRRIPLHLPSRAKKIPMRGIYAFLKSEA
jgi:hypothetical protein